jgi:hypothetical protein
MKFLIFILIVCAISCVSNGKSLSLILKEKESDSNESSVDRIDIPVPETGIFILESLEENLSRFQDMIYETNNQMRSMMESAGIPLVQQSIKFLRLWRNQANRFTKSLGNIFG